MAAAAESTAVGTDHRVARAVTEASTPPVVAAATMVAFALAGAGSLRTGVAWALLGALLTVAVPYAVAWGAARHALPSGAPPLLALATWAAGVVVLAGLGAPRPLVAVVVVLVATRVAVTCVDQVWRLSAHAAVAAAAAETLVIAYGQWMTPLFVAVAVVAWSRVRLAEHSPAQVVAGAVTGVVLAPAGYVLIA